MLSNDKYCFLKVNDFEKETSSSHAYLFDCLEKFKFNIICSKNTEFNFTLNFEKISIKKFCTIIKWYFVI